MFRPSDRQAALARFPQRWQNAEGLYQVIAEGAMGAGKTGVLIRAWLAWQSRYLTGLRHGMLFQEHGQARDTLSAEADDWAHSSGLRIKMTAHEWIVESMLGPPNIIRLKPFGKATQSRSALKSFNWASVFIDEINEIHPESLEMVKSRLRTITNPVLCGTLNPDTRRSYGRQFRDSTSKPLRNGDIQGEYHRLLMSDNPSLPGTYQADQERNFAFAHDRMAYIHGEWADPEGLVYPKAARTWHPVDEPEGRVRPAPSTPPSYYCAGVDYADKTVTHAVLIGAWPEGLWVVDEWVHDARLKGSLTVSVQAARMHARFTAAASVRWWTVDCTSDDFIPALTAIAHGQVVTSAKAPVYESCNRLGIFLNGGWLWLSPTAPETINSIDSLRWDEQPSYGRPVMPVKDGLEHGADGLRYAAMRITLPAGRSPALALPIPA